MPAPIDVFFSYVHQDEALRDELDTHLAALSRQGVIRGWHDRRIGAGQDWRAAIDAHLEKARVILLLVSADFLASDYCFDVELKRALARCAAGEAEVIPILLRECDLVGVPFAHLAAFPRNARPVMSWTNRDQAWASVALGIRAALEALDGRSGNGAPAVQPAAVVPSPYDPWMPAVPPWLAGRSAIICGLEEALDQRRSVSLVGDSRIGKSSVLKTWEQKARAAGRVVTWVSGEEASGQSLGAFVRAVTGREGADDPDAAAEALDRWAQETAPQKLPPIVLVDEVDGMVRRFPERFFERVRGMLGRHALVLVLASRRDLDALYKDMSRTSPFFNLVERHWVGLLEPEAAEEVIQWGAGLLAAKDEAAMRRWAGRHPFYLQLLGGYLVSARRQRKSTARAVMRFQEQAASQLRNLWQSLGEKEREDLRTWVMRGVPVKRKSLRWRGVVTEEGAPFGKVLVEWMREEA